MPTTPIRQYPYPSLAGANDPPRDIQLLAEAIAADVQQLAIDAFGTGGIYEGVSDDTSSIRIPHGLTTPPTKVTLLMGTSATIEPTRPRDYVCTLGPVTETEIHVRLTNLRNPVWAGPGVRAVIAWTARK